MFEGFHIEAGSHKRHDRPRNARRFSAVFVFYVITGLQIAATTPTLAEILQDQPGGVRQCFRKMAGGKEDRMARSWHRNGPPVVCIPRREPLS